MILNYVVEANAPLNVVSLPSFQNLLKTVSGKNIKIPSRYTIARQLEKEYKKLRQMLQDILDKQKYVCTTSDVWSKRGQAFLGVSVHFIDEFYRRHSYLLAFRKLEKRQTYDYLGQTLFQINEEYNLCEKITHSITDGGSNFGKAHRMYGPDARPDVCDPDVNIIPESQLFPSEDEDSDCEREENSEKETTENNVDDNIEFVTDSNVESNELDFDEFILLSSDISLPKQLRCFAHLLNLIGKKDFLKWLQRIESGTYKSFVRAYAKLKLLWNAYNKRPRAKTIIQNTINAGLTTPVDTRWNSEFDSIVVAEKHKDKVIIIYSK